MKSSPEKFLRNRGINPFFIWSSYRCLEEFTKTTIFKDGDVVGNLSREIKVVFVEPLTNIEKEFLLH